MLIAEAYWDMESELQNQGFDFCYDKRLYDRIATQDTRGVREHLRADLDYQSKLLRFLENHDEPRIASRLGVEAEMAAAVAIATLPGGTLWHEGQFEGRRVRPPVFLSRRPDEQPNHHLAAWYRRLLTTVSDRDVKRGRWQLLEATGWPDNQSCDNLLAWSWSGDDARHVVVVNFSAHPAQARIHLDAGRRPASRRPPVHRPAHGRRSIFATAPRSPTSACTSTCSRGSPTSSPWTVSPSDPTHRSATESASPLPPTPAVAARTRAGRQ